MQNAPVIQDIIQIQNLLNEATPDEIREALKWWRETKIKMSMGGTYNQPLLIDRWTAHARGLRHFYTGRQCKRGHVAMRYVQNGSCVDCMNLTKAPAARTNNVVMPPSGLVFPGELPRGFITPKLVSKVWGRVLRLLPPIVHEECVAAGWEPPKVETWEPRVTQWATKVFGWQTWQEVLAACGSEQEAYKQGYFLLPILRSEGGEGPHTTAEFAQWLKDGHTHAEAAALGCFVGWEPEDK